MTYLPVGDDEVDCEMTPDDEVCKVLHPPAPAPADTTPPSSWANDIIKKGLDAIKGGSASAASTPGAGSSHTVLIVIGAAGALWYLLRKKK